MFGHDIENNGVLVFEIFDCWCFPNSTFQTYFRVFKYTPLSYKPIEIIRVPGQEVQSSIVWSIPDGGLGVFGGLTLVLIGAALDTRDWNWVKQLDKITQELTLQLFGSKRRVSAVQTATVYLSRTSCCSSGGWCTSRPRQPAKDKLLELLA